MSGQNIQAIINSNIGRRKSAEAAAKKSARMQNPNKKNGKLPLSQQRARRLVKKHLSEMERAA